MQVTFVAAPCPFAALPLPHFAPLQLRDVFHLFNKQKRQFTLLSAHRNKGGTMPPINDQKAIRIVSERLVKQDEQGE